MALENNTFIGKGTWLDKIAYIIVKREEKLGRPITTIRVESGLGASGFPHIGSLGDAVRAYGVSLALKNQGYNSELIAYSDDMDGLRKVPTGLPQWLHDYIAKPVSEIPDPFGNCHDSYGSHMSGLLLESLDKLGVNYKFQSGYKSYTEGKLNKQIETILENSARLGKKISELVGQEKYTETLPYFPICQNCGRLYVAQSTKFHREDKKIEYHCSGTRIGNTNISGCGYSDEIDINKGCGKLAWKVEFAARWKAFDIRFEAFGKDIMDSVKVNDWVCNEILEYPHPVHVKYEMFLDKKGQKISKSSGNVITPQMWLQYGSPQSLMLLLFKRIAGTRHIGIDDIPNLMDEYDLYENLYFGKVKESNQAKLVKIKGIYEYIHHLNPPDKPMVHIPYRMLLQQSSLFKNEQDDVKDKIVSRLLKYNLVEEKDKNENLYLKIDNALSYIRDNEIFEDNSIVLNEAEKKAVYSLYEELKCLDSGDPEHIQTVIFETAKKNNIKPRDFFKLLYKLILGQDKGPKLGSYIADLGVDRSCQILSKYTQN